MLDEKHRQTIAASYLVHVLIALEANDRGAPFRDFLDNWFSYDVGGRYLTTGGRPVWFNNPCAHKHQQALSKMHFISGAARIILAQAKDNRQEYLTLRNDKTLQ